MGRWPKHASGAWSRLVSGIQQWEQDAIISHEFFGAADPGQAQRAIDALAPAEVHLVFTARAYHRQISAIWQERLKNLWRGRFRDFRLRADGGPLNQWDWRTQDAADVLGRWSCCVPADRIHLVTVPAQGGSPALLWSRFARVCGIDAEACDTSVASPNVSLGVVEAELLRRINTKIDVSFPDPGEPSRLMRGFLAHKLLAPRESERFSLPPQRADALRPRSESTAAWVNSAGVDVVGSLGDLTIPSTVPVTRQPEEVSDAELAAAATEVAAAMLLEVRGLLKRPASSVPASPTRRARLARRVPKPVKPLARKALTIFTRDAASNGR
jgi:hypothetical protein